MTETVNLKQVVLRQSSSGNRISDMARKSTNRTVESKSPNRTGRPLSVYLDQNVFDAMEKFRDSQEFSPGYTKIVNAALREYFQRRGIVVED